MPRRREGVGKALRRALGEEVVLPRIEPRKPGVSYLMNGRRLRIYQEIFNEPGLHLREIQRKMSIPLQSLRWHISVLLSSGLVDGVSIGKKTALLSPISANRDDIVRRTMFRDEKFGTILQAISREGTVSVRSLVREMGSYQQLVSARMKTLKKTGLVQSAGRGSSTRFSLGPAALGSDLQTDPREIKEKLLRLLVDQGLAPKVRQMSGRLLTVQVETALEELEMQFKL